MEQSILKKDTIFTGNGLRIFMFIRHELDDFDVIVPIVKKSLSCVRLHNQR